MLRLEVSFSYAANTIVMISAAVLFLLLFFFTSLSKYVQRQNSNLDSTIEVCGSHRYLQFLVTLVSNGDRLVTSRSSTTLYWKLCGLRKVDEKEIKLDKGKTRMERKIRSQ